MLNVWQMDWPGIAVAAGYRRLRTQYPITDDREIIEMPWNTQRASAE